MLACPAQKGRGGLNGAALRCVISCVDDASGHGSVTCGIGPEVTALTAVIARLDRKSGLPDLRLMRRNSARAELLCDPVVPVFERDHGAHHDSLRLLDCPLSRAMTAEMHWLADMNGGLPRVLNN